MDAFPPETRRSAPWLPGSPRGPEAGPGDGRDAGLLQETLFQRLGGHAGRPNVGEGVEGAARLHAGNAGQAVELRDREAPAPVEGGDHLVHRVLRAGQRREPRVLGGRVDAGVGIDGQTDRGVRQDPGPDPVAEAPAGHGVGLAPAVEQDHPFAQALVGQQARVAPAVVEHAAVDLVGEDRDLREIGQHGGDPLDLLGRDDAAGGIGRAVEDEQPGPGAQAGPQRLGRHGEAGRLVERQRHRIGARVADHGLVDWETRIRIGDLDPGLAEQQNGEVHGDLAAGHHDDMGRVQLDAQAPMQLRRHGLAQRQDAARVRIAVVAVTQRLDRGFDDVGRRLEVGLADAEVDDGAPLAGQLAGPAQHFERAFVLQPGDRRHGLEHESAFRNAVVGTRGGPQPTRFRYPRTSGTGWLLEGENAVLKLQQSQELGR
jgi:hypothetical protein